jgi:hypothetical protein
MPPPIIFNSRAETVLVSQEKKSPRSRVLADRTYTIVGKISIAGTTAGETRKTHMSMADGATTGTTIEIEIEIGIETEIGTAIDIGIGVTTMFAVETMIATAVVRATAHLVTRSNQATQCGMYRRTFFAGDSVENLNRQKSCSN